MNIQESILVNNPCYKENRKITVKGLMIHSVGCSQPDAKVFINGWNKPTYDRACVHAFIDGNNGTIYQTLPWTTRGWHCGGSGNNTHIGVEMCEPATIKYTGGATFTVTNSADAKAVVKRTYESAVELFAYLCTLFNLDPLADGVILSHSEGGKRGIASGHSDPEHLWTQTGSSYTMSGFRKDIKNKMSEKNQNGLKPNKIQDDLFVWKWLRNAGFSEIATSGIMGNMYAESGIRSNNLQNSFEKSLGLSDVEYTTKVDSKEYSKEKFVNDKAGYGLCQWTYWSRKESLYNYLKNKNYSIAELQGQLEYFLTELKTKYGSVYKDLNSATTILQASNAMLLGFEKPKNQTEANQKMRASYCQAYYDKYATGKSVPFTVKVTIPNLIIRTGPGTNFSKTDRFTGVGTFTIIEVSSGEGSVSGWGKLKSGLGWISLDYCERK